MTMTTSFELEVDYIVADRRISRRGVQPYTEYLVKWRGLPESEASWERADTLWQFEDQIAKFHEENATRTSAPWVGESVTSSSFFPKIALMRLTTFRSLLEKPREVSKLLVHSLVHLFLKDVSRNVLEDV